jgi:hypothetical protein
MDDDGPWTMDDGRWTMDDGRTTDENNDDESARVDNERRGVKVVVIARRQIDEKGLRGTVYQKVEESRVVKLQSQPAY